MSKPAQRGFTLIELLVVIAIIGLLATVVLASLRNARSKSRSARAIADLKQLTTALEIYYSDNKTYPISSSGGTGWDGLYTNFGVASANWIAGLTPTSIAALPRSPNNSTSGNNNYVYRSNGQDYKLIWLLAENCTTIVAAYPGLADPNRTGANCAFGFYTSGAAAW